MGIIKGKLGVYLNGDFGIRRNFCDRCKFWIPEDKKCSKGIYKHFLEDCIQIKLLDKIKEQTRIEKIPTFNRYTIKGVSSVLGISESTVRNYSKKGMGYTKTSKNSAIGYKWTIPVNIYDLQIVKEWLIENNMKDKADKIDRHIEIKLKQFNEYIELL